MVRFHSLLDPDEVESLAARAGLVDAPDGASGTGSTSAFDFDPQPLVPPGATPAHALLAVDTSYHGGRAGERSGVFDAASTDGFEQVPSSSFGVVPAAGIRKTRRSGQHRTAITGSFRVAGARAHSGAVAIAPSLPSTGPLTAALDALLDWCGACTGASSVFVADAEGLPLMVRGVDDELVAFSAALRRTVRLAASDGASAALDLGPRGRLHVLWWRSGVDLFALGAVTTDPVNPSVLDAMRRTLDDPSALVGD